MSEWNFDTFSPAGLSHIAPWRKWAETHSRSTNYRDSGAVSALLLRSRIRFTPFVASGAGVLVLALIGIVTATEMDAHTRHTFAHTATNSQILPVTDTDTFPWRNHTPDHQAFAFGLFSLLPLPRFCHCFRRLYIVRDVRISLLLHLAARQLQHIAALSSFFFPFIYESVFHVVFHFANGVPVSFDISFYVLVDSGQIEFGFPEGSSKRE